MENQYLKDAYNELYRSVDFIRKVHQILLEEHEQLKTQHSEYMVMNENLKKECEESNTSYTRVLNDYLGLRGVETDLVNTNNKLSELMMELQNLKKQKEVDNGVYEGLVGEYSALKGVEANLATANEKLTKEAGELKMEVENLKKKSEEDIGVYNKLFEDYIKLEGLHIEYEQLKKDLKVSCTCGAVQGMLASSSSSD